MSEFYVGIVGHRNLDAGAASFVARACAAILRLQQAQHERLVALSALAEGADTIFAEVAVDLGIPLEIIRPFAAYATDFTGPEARARYDRLRTTARFETRLRHPARSDGAYREAMIWVVDHSDVVVVVWDGQPARGEGGTGEAATYIRARQRTWIHVDTLNYSVTSHNTR